MTAGPSGEVASAVGDDRIMGQVRAQIGHHRRHIDRGRLRRGHKGRFIPRAGMGAPCGPSAHDRVKRCGKGVGVRLHGQGWDVDFAQLVRSGVHMDQGLRGLGH